MTNEEIYHNFMQAAVNGFCANGNWATDADPIAARIENASKIATLALEDHRKRWPRENIVKKTVEPEIAGGPTVKTS